MPFASTLTAEATATDVAEDSRNAATYLLELRARPADQRGDTFDADVASAVDAINFNEPILRALEAGERSAEPDPAEGNGPTAALSTLEGAQSLGGQIVDSDEFRNWAASETRGNFRAEAEFRATLATGSLGAEGEAFPFVPLVSPTLSAQTVRQRRLFIRDLCSTGPTGVTNNVPYIQEQNGGTNETAAAMKPEATAVGEATMEFTRKDAPVRTIQAWIPVTMETMTDAPTLRTYIDTRLTYMVMLREEDQALNGDGTGVNLLGIRQQAGLQTQGALGASGVLDVPKTLTGSYGKIENVDGDPDGVAMNPVDYWTAVGTRHSEQFDNGGGGMAPSTVQNISWGEPVVRTRAMESGKALAGSYRIGATILDRTQGVEVIIGDQHADFLTKGLTAVVARKRTALQVHRPDLFVETDIAQAA